MFRSARETLSHSGFLILPIYGLAFLYDCLAGSFFSLGIIHNISSMW